MTKPVDIADFAPNWAGSFVWSFYEPKDGDLIVREHPFTQVSQTVSEDFSGKPWTETRWRPGAWDMWIDHYGEEEMRHHATGSASLNVVCVAKPKGFPRRILYTRQFTAPNGHAFKRSGLLCHSIAKFRKDCSGPRFESVLLPDAEPVAL